MKKLPPSVRDQFRTWGRLGGKTRSERLAPEARRAIARQAAIRRWVQARFGGESFQALGLPGGEIVDEGLLDLAHGRETAASLALAEAAPRLRREGVPLPAIEFEEPATKLYRLIEAQSGDLAHARYQAMLRQLSSFADACTRVRVGKSRHA